MPSSDANGAHPSSGLTLHRAAWILPISSPPIMDGIVAVQDGRILEAGPSKAMLKEYALSLSCGGSRPVLLDHGDGTILPSLVNTHTHLELSCLVGKAYAWAGFVEWIKNLIKAREACSSRDVDAGILSSIKDLRQRGIGLVGDTSNTGISILPLRESGLAGRVFLEAIGFRPQKEIENWKFIQSIIPYPKPQPPKPQPIDYPNAYSSPERGFQVCLAAHAPYSVSSRYLQLLQKDPLWPKHFFSIHVAESEEESIFLSTGEGELKQFLIDRGGWDPDWVPPRTTPVQYLFQQGILRANTICVHAVQVCDEDIEILARTYSKVCICPRSNHTLGVGLAPVEKFLQLGVSVSLGTDSLASNTSLCLWQEMFFLKNALPSLSCSQILQMATLSGALALGEKGFGSIEAGKYASLIFLPITASSAAQVEEALVLEGHAKDVRWISQ